MSLTPSMLKCSANQSGYRYVVPCGGGRGWQASRNGGGRPDGWRGPMRKTPREAAQDYCDWCNGQPLAGLPPALSRAGHPQRQKRPRSPEVETALGILRDDRAQRQGQPGYVYCIGVEGDPAAVKIGYSVNPAARVGELQSGNPHKLVLLGQRKGSLATEERLHSRYLPQNVLGEWFRPTTALLSEFGLTLDALKAKEAAT